MSDLKDLINVAVDTYAFDRLHAGKILLEYINLEHAMIDSLSINNHADTYQRKVGLNHLQMLHTILTSHG